ncbi:RsmB/NOP family class I SAM-dependent RNA methyltransferase [Bacteroidales bacterium OttesenSCG-928-M11]|nr:RsmB/NOP family class I SAM-dependent RNA methyltransferase [Bacteroidales bacterium OttesenSCG-928-M11]
MRLPETFVLRMKDILDNDNQEWNSFITALSEDSPISVRLNPCKTSDTTLSSDSISKLFDEPVSWASNAYYLKSKPIFTLDPLFHAGTYYVQEASSMYLDTLIKQYVSSPVKVLDLCAAPGGKSTLLSSALPKGSLLVTNEVIHSRANILVENMVKWGSPHTIVTNNDPSAFRKTKKFFDLVVADVPCSGEGMFRKDSTAIAEWSPANVDLCAKRQRRIIADVWASLKPGGLLIYSTCTYNREENEDNIEWIADELGADIVSAKHFFPHRSKGEGFFISLLRKNGEASPEKVSKADKKTKPLTTNWITCPEDYVSVPENPYQAIPLIHYNDYCTLRPLLKILSAGVLLGEVKGKDVLPAHALAMSTALNTNAFLKWEVDCDTALRYLRREALQNIPSDFPNTHILITYQGRSLGFVKNIGSRANNLYPNDWRIRMSIK